MGSPWLLKIIYTNTLGHKIVRIKFHRYDGGFHSIGMFVFRWLRNYLNPGFHPPLAEAVDELFYRLDGGNANKVESDEDSEYDAESDLDAFCGAQYDYSINFKRGYFSYNDMECSFETIRSIADKEFFRMFEYLSSSSSSGEDEDEKEEESEEESEEEVKEPACKCQRIETNDDN